MSDIERPIVAKIGSESQGTPEGFRSGMAYVQSNDIGILVVSAMGGSPKVTDLLIACSPEWGQNHPFHEIWCAVRQNFVSIDAIFAEIRRRYTSMGQDLGYSGLGPELDEAERIIGIASRLDSEAEREHYGYLIVSRGEWLSGHMWADLLGYRFQDSTELIRFRKNGQFNEHSYGLIGSLCSKGDKLVIPGFYGLGYDGRIRLFPRNGSDLTAAYIARGINASEYQNLKGVDGVLSADPKILKKFGKKAILILEMTYDEYDELAYGGFRVLHQDVTAPLAAARIPLRVLNPEKSQDDSDYRGSLIVPRRDITGDEDVIGVAGTNGFAAFKISKRGMEYEKGIARKILQIFERVGISITHPLTELNSITVFLTENQLMGDRKDKIREEIERKIRPDEMRFDSVGILSAVGLGIRRHRTRVDMILSSALHKEGIKSLGGVSGYKGISVAHVFNDDELEKAISVAHEALIENRQTKV